MVDVVGVAWRAGEDEMAAFVERYGLGFPTAIDADGSLFARHGVLYQPAWVFVSADGTARAFAGVLDAGELDEVMAALAAGA